ncbi:ATP/GTP-binding protein [uncultured Veillonella sp.]|uniref:AAA family ATPase n=1 Tax=uncultured Veillonella sp. TaxID=159268 RepID=UPI0025957BA9|nr:ATP-binding protein [uncultured Veillonella sp.]
MLISIAVKNFRSFYEKTVFSMETGARLRKYTDTNTHKRKQAHLIKSAFIFGGNANGKTNVINLFKLLKALVMRPTRSEVDYLITDTFADNSEPTEIMIKFLKNDKVFEYTIEYVKNRVITEILKVNGNGIFARVRDDITLPQGFETLGQYIRKNQVLLFFAQNNNIPEAKEAYEWIATDLIIPIVDDIQYSIFNELKQNKSLKEKTIAFLQAADFNILDLELRERTIKIPVPLSLKVIDGEPELEKGDIVEHKIPEIYCVHRSNESEQFILNLDNESAGTKIFLLLAVYILQNRTQNKVFLIDEFDSSLHIKLTELLLNLFNKWNTSSQFITTTHAFDLMDRELRPDQIYFVEKNRFGKSELYSVFDFDDPALKRQDYQYKSRYLQGVYGADQIVDYTSIADALGVEDE